jgi:hypothetical protein
MELWVGTRRSATDGVHRTTFFLRFARLRARTSPRAMSALAQYGKRGLLLIGGGYLAAVNAAAVALFYYDKQQATTHGWRVRA